MWIKRKKDIQKQKVYKAECLFIERLKDTHFIVFSGMFQNRTLGEIEVYCSDLIKSKWFQKRWPQIKEVKVISSEKQGASGILRGKIAKMRLPENMRNKFIVLHEFSHSCDNSREAWHGAPFCRIFLELIRHEFGDQIFDIMKECFEKEDVEFTRNSK